MRSKVAIVETRPETVAADHRRLFRLAGLGQTDRRVLADAARGDDGAPVSPPWQLAAVLENGGAPGAIYALDAEGGPAPEVAAWSGVLAAAGTGLAAAGDWRRRRTGSEGLTALAEALRDGAALPRGLVGEPLLVASGVAVGGGWPVAASLELIARLVAPRPARRRRFSATGAEVLADALALVQGAAEIAGAVVDGVNWRVRAGVWRRVSLLGNVLLAGRDPVAVDAVACRLAGADPRRVPWLRLCAERGLGRCDPEAIEVIGRSELTELGLEVPPPVLVPAGAGPLPGGARLGWLSRLRPRWKRTAAADWAGVWRDLAAQEGGGP